MNPKLLITTAPLLIITLLANINPLWAFSIDNSANKNLTITRIDQKNQIDVDLSQTILIAILIQLIGTGLTITIMLIFYKLTPKNFNRKPSKLNQKTSSPIPHCQNINQPTSSVKKTDITAEITKMETTIARLNMAIKMNPNDANLYSKRANFRKNKLKDKQGALEDYNTAMRLTITDKIHYKFTSSGNLITY
ncbi:MAG: hypothetical protein ACFCUV_05275 [Rivularia sp. (in: cyanobacteria)]